MLHRITEQWHVPSKEAAVCIQKKEGKAMIKVSRELTEFVFAQNKPMQVVWGF